MKLQERYRWNKMLLGKAVNDSHTPVNLDLYSIKSKITTVNGNLRKFKKLEMSSFFPLLKYAATIFSHSSFIFVLTPSLLLCPSVNKVINLLIKAAIVVNHYAERRNIISSISSCSQTIIMSLLIQVRSISDLWEEGWPDVGKKVDLLSLCSLNSLRQVNKTSHLCAAMFQSKQSFLVRFSDLKEKKAKCFFSPWNAEPSRVRIVF